MGRRALIGTVAAGPIAAEASPQSRSGGRIRRMAAEEACVTGEQMDAMIAFGRSVWNVPDLPL